jgi:hypothetical protein
MFVLLLHISDYAPNARQRGSVCQGQDKGKGRFFLAYALLTLKIKYHCKAYDRKNTLSWFFLTAKKE